MNKIVVTKVLGDLFKHGVRDFCLCAGSRNSAFVSALNNVRDSINLYQFFEERSAAFFALGKCMGQSRTPVAVVVTSGTAVAELLPACIEAFYQKRPLILVTADRPKTYRGTGAPQAIEQSELFLNFVDSSFDLDLENFKTLNLEEWAFQGPLHINCCLEEEDYEDLVVKVPDELVSNQRKKWTPAKKNEKRLHKFLNQAQNLVVLLGTCSPQEAEEYYDLVDGLNAPIWADLSSNLVQKFPHKTIFTDESFLVKNNWTDVLRIGGVPSCRFWRDLEKSKNIRVCSVGNFSGLSRESVLLEPACYRLEQNFQNSYALDIEIRDAWKKYLEQFPESEVSQVYKLSSYLEEDAVVFLGNSLPIREWNQYAEVKRGQLFFASRGANGIDGQLSAALGVAEVYADKPVWIILGDLTTLYDLSAPALLKQLLNQNIKIVILNNSGGGIFSRVSRYAEAPMAFHKLMKNENVVDFEAWAKMWKLPFSRTVESARVIQHSSVLELLCSSQQTKNHLNQL